MCTTPLIQPDHPDPREAAPGLAPPPILVPDEAAAIALAQRRPRLRIEVFEPDWPAVDRGRTRVAGAGLSARIGVHHRDVLSSPLIRAALRGRSGAAVVLIASSPGAEAAGPV